ncbi:aldo/keto reductase [Vulgatibacter sp.]|uniref:aldo/keto reductase n=1 Tax=Vulgatibacter sp. TaxID=1971226 RepID=UPI00356369C6
MIELSRRTFLHLAAGAAALAATPALAAKKERQPLITRTIPSTGEVLPAVGMGTWQTFDVGAAEAERAPLREVLRTFFDGGGRLIDSSPMYGRSEAVVGDLVSAGGWTKLPPFLATKVWTRGREDGIAQMNESFRRMRTERIDLMQVHNLVDVETHLATLRTWKEQGRVRQVGITHYQVGAFDEVERLMKAHPLDFVQLPYSVGVRDAEKRLLPLARERGIAVLVMRPFEGGSLLREARAKPLPALAAALGATSWAQLFLLFILANPAVTCAIPATGKPAHMAENVAAMRCKLPDEAQRKQLLAAIGA